MQALQITLAFLSPIVVALLGVVQVNWRRKDREDAEKFRAQQEAEAVKREQDYIALKDGVRSLLRSSIMGVHHQCVAKGYATTVDKEVIQRDFDAYRALDGNGVAIALHDEVMAMETREDR